MNEMLKEASQQGNIDSLYALIREDVYMLKKIDNEPFVDTPLHIAAEAGQTHFAMETMRLMPSFSRKQNQDGFTPLHLALQNGRSQTVLQLVEENGDLVRIKGREGKTPLHYAAEIGDLQLLAEFLAACPNSIQDLTIRKENALHVAAKNNQLEALKVMFGWIEHTGLTMLPERTDDEGNTILHIATLRGNSQMVSWLIGKVDLRIRNLQGYTARGIIEQRPLQLNNREITQIRSMLRRHSQSIDVFSVISLRHKYPTHNLADYLRENMSFVEKWAISSYRRKLSRSEEYRGAVLVVAVLIATATYQAVLSPPSGNWQGDPQLRFPLNSTTADYDDGSNGNGPLDYVGITVLSVKKWTIFSVLNTLSFSVSIIVIHNLLPCEHYITLSLVIPLVCCYALSNNFIAPFNFYYLMLLCSCLILAHLKFTLVYFVTRRRLWALKRLQFESSLLVKRSLFV